MNEIDAFSTGPAVKQEDSKCKACGAPVDVKQLTISDGFCDDCLIQGRNMD